jgi:WD40 repeat protein
MIQIYSVWTFEILGVLKGHNGKIRSLYFTQDDSVLVSAGTDGAVYTWNTREFKRENEHILKTCSYSSAICTADGKTVYAVGIDHLLKEITESSVIRELNNTSILTQVILSNSGRMMFAGALY